LEENVNHILFNRACQFCLDQRQSGSVQGQGPQTILGASLDSGVTGQKEVVIFGFLTVAWGIWNVCENMVMEVKMPKQPQDVFCKYSMFCAAMETISHGSGEGEAVGADG
jgi:hypothetical protein